MCPRWTRFLVVRRVGYTNLCERAGWCAETGSDMTGGALSWVAAEFPGAHFATQGVHYVTVCGETVTGDKRDKKSKAKPTPTNYAHNSYLEVRPSDLRGRTAPPVGARRLRASPRCRCAVKGKECWVTGSCRSAVRCWRVRTRSSSRVFSTACPASARLKTLAVRHATDPLCYPTECRLCLMDAASRWIGCLETYHLHF